MSTSNPARTQTPTDDLPMAGRLALVTGASRGIGQAVARAYAQAGADLILVSRTSGALEELDDEIQAMGRPPATLVPLDLTDFDAIDRLGATIHERWGRLDVLVGNAAILGALTPITHILPTEWNKVIGTNLTANWRLIRSMDPLLRQSDAGRAIFVTSGVARTPQPYWASYAISKAALEHLVKIYAEECRNTSVRANILDPTRMRTRMRAQAKPGEDPQSLPEPAVLAPLFLELASPDCVRVGETVVFGG